MMIVSLNGTLVTSHIWYAGTFHAVNERRMTGVWLNLVLIFDDGSFLRSVSIFLTVDKISLKDINQ